MGVRLIMESRLLSTQPTDGSATPNLRYNFRNLIQKLEYQLKKHAEAHGRDNSDFRAKVQALNAACALYQGLCGHEEPMWVVRHG